MVTVIVLGILVGIGAPSLSRFVETNRLVGLTNDLVADINIARSEAIKRGAAAGVCAASGTSCAASTDWGASGWIVVYDSDDNGTLDTLLKTHVPATANSTVTAPAGTITFNRVGGTAGVGDILVCNTKLNQLRKLSIVATGRVSLDKSSPCP